MRKTSTPLGGILCCYSATKCFYENHSFCHIKFSIHLFTRDQKSCFVENFGSQILE